MIDEAAIRLRWETVGARLDERGRRLFAAAEVRSAGRGGLALVSKVTGLARSTINRGEDDLDGEPLAKGRVRRAGGGRRSVSRADPGLVPALKRLVEPATLGDPTRSLIWVSKSMAKLAAALTEMGHPISADTVGAELAKLGFSRQSNRKADEGSHHLDRNAQFEHINAKVVAAQACQQPVISVDTKKKELLGNFKNGGTDYRSCPEAWCSSRRLTTTISGMGPDRSDHHGGQSDDRIIAQRGHGFQGHVAGALDGPFVVLFEEYGSDESGDGFVVGENANDFGPSFDFAVEPLEAIGGMDLGPVIDGEAHVGEDVVLGLVHEEGELWQLGPELIGDLAPLRLGGLGAVLSKGGSHEGGDDAPAALAGVASALRIVWTRQRCQVAFISLATAALIPSWASETTSLTPRRPRLRSLRKNSVQKVSASDGPMSMPSTSRRPSALTPTAMITATETMRWLRRTFT